MSDIRYFEERLCPHGRSVGLPHCPVGHDHGGAVDWCPGGERREITVDYEAALAVRRKWFGGVAYRDVEQVRSIVDAALAREDTRETGSR